MKGLKEYVEKHGRHFTEELAYAVSGCRWTYKEIDKSLQKKVYYNVSGCTPGDIAYCVNGLDFDNRRDAVSFLLRCVLYDVGLSDTLFNLWVMDNDSFDFTPYI